MERTSYGSSFPQPFLLKWDKPPTANNFDFCGPIFPSSFWSLGNDSLAFGQTCISILSPFFSYFPFRENSCVKRKSMTEYEVQGSLAFCNATSCQSLRKLKEFLKFSYKLSKVTLPSKQILYVFVSSNPTCLVLNPCFPTFSIFQLYWSFEPLWVFWFTLV